MSTMRGIKLYKLSYLLDGIYNESNIVNIVCVCVCLIDLIILVEPHYGSRAE